NFHGMNNVKDGKVVYVPETEDFKKLVAFLHRLYADGLINQEVITQDWSQFDSRSKDPAIARVGYTFGWSIDQRAGDVWADQYIVFEPIAAEAGIKPLFPSDPNGMKVQANKAQITASTQHPEAAIRFLD